MLGVLFSPSKMLVGFSVLDCSFGQTSSAPLTVREEGLKCVSLSVFIHHMTDNVYLYIDFLARMIFFSICLALCLISPGRENDTVYISLVQVCCSAVCLHLLNR